MERAVARGLLEPAEFHCKRAEMMASLASGVDDCRTRTQGTHVCPVITPVTSNKTYPDHYIQSVSDLSVLCSEQLTQYLKSLPRLSPFT